MLGRLQALEAAGPARPSTGGALYRPLGEHLSRIDFVQQDPSRGWSPTTLMTNTLDRIQTLAARNEVRVSLHGSEELAADDVQVRDVIAGVATAVMVEDYPDYPKGRCCLVLQRDVANRPVHVVWGIPSGRESPAVVVTAYRPDPLRWDQTWRRRRK